MSVFLFSIDQDFPVFHIDHFSTISKGKAFARNKIQ